jgi:23S rRNA (cytidine1920-2'-O)/16S rRNA (cytidine1409-2'-O)-methyltransferase
VVKKRVDVLLVERSLAESRERAKSLIMAGLVHGGGKKFDKPGAMVDESMELELKGKDHPYVSRGGVKLEALLDKFDINITDKVTLDIGASTGGFTDCLLKRGAASVTAVDVGKGQIDWKLRNDPRVKLIENFNARDITGDNIGSGFDLVVIDVSFISLELILAPAASVTAPGGRLIALVKPQFEAGRGEVGKGGIVKDAAVQKKCVEKIKDFGASIGLTLAGEMESPITGAKGNREFFVLFQRSE